MAGYNNVKYEIVADVCNICEERKLCFRVDNSSGEYLAAEFCLECIQRKFTEADEKERDETIAVKAEMYRNLFDWLVDQEFIDDCYDDSMTKVLKEFTADDVLTFLHSSCWAHYQNRYEIIYHTFRKKFGL